MISANGVSDGVSQFYMGGVMNCIWDNVVRYMYAL